MCKIFYVLDKKSVNPLRDEIVKQYEFIRKFEHEIGFTMNSITPILRGTTGTTKDRWEKILNKLENVTATFLIKLPRPVITIKVVKSSDKIRKVHFDGNGMNKELKSLLRKCHPSIANRVEAEYYVNKELAIKMANSCKSIEECNALYDFNH